MAASGFTLEAVRDFIIQRGGRVTNHELVTRFKSELNDPQWKGKNREHFKDFVNTLATIKVDERGEKVLMLKKKYRPDASDQGQRSNDLAQDSRNEVRASSEPPTKPTPSTDHEAMDYLDGGGMSKVRSETDIASGEATPGTTLTESGSMGTISESSITSSVISQGSQQSISSSADLEDDVNASVISVKDRAKHLNRMETESELQRVTHHKKKEIRSRDRDRDTDDDSHSSGSVYSSLEPHEREWLVVCSSGDYHPMHKLLTKNPDLVRVRDFTNTAVHWAAKHGKPEVLKLVVGRDMTDVNKRTGYTPLHLASMHGHEQIIELLVQTFKADPNIRDFSGKKAKQYLPNSASSKAQQMLLTRRLGASLEMLLTRRLGASLVSSRCLDDSFTRSQSFRKSNRAKAISSLIQTTSAGMRKVMLRTTWTGSSENVMGERHHHRGLRSRSPSTTPPGSAGVSPHTNRRGMSTSDLMPPPVGPARRSSKTRECRGSRESLEDEDRRMMVSRSESEPNFGLVQPGKKTYI